MAKKPQNTKQDPTAAAMAAIEDALNLNAVPAPQPPANEPTMAPPAPPAGGQQRPGRRLERANRGPANDDRQAVGQILAALHHRPSAMPYAVAALLSTAWISLTVLIGYMRSSKEIASGVSLLDLPGFWTFFTLLTLPPVAFFLMASFVRRTQEMRMVARAMTEVTVRLAEPEGVSTDAIVSVGQAIRREVAALGDGIERAIARATELETMVRDEVSTLERAYDENEMRVRTLVEGLQSERDGIVSHGNRLRDAVTNAHEGFNLDVKNVTDSVNAVVDQAVARITDHIAAQSETARRQVEEAGDVVLESFTSKSNDMTDRLTQIGVEVANAIVTRTAKVTEELNTVTTGVTDKLDEAMEEIASSITTKGDAVRDVLASRLRAAEDSIAQRGNEIADRVAADSAALARRITDGLQGFDTTVRVYGTGLLDQITQTVDYVNDHTKTTLLNFDERVGIRIRETQEGLDSRIGRIEETIDSRAKALNEALANRTLELANTLNEGGKIATDAVEKSLLGADEYFANKAQEIAGVLSSRTEAIDQTLGKRAQEMTEGLDSRIAIFEEQVTKRLEGITNSIETRGISAADQLATKVYDVTGEMETRLNALSTDVTGRVNSLSGDVTERINTLSGDLGTRVEALTSEISTRVREVTDDLTAKASGATSDLSAKIEAVSGLLRSDANEVERSLVQLADQVSKTLIERTREVTSSHETLRNDVNNVLSQLGDANTLMKSTLAGITDNLTPLAGTVTDRIAAFQNTLESSLLAARSSIEHMDGQMRDLRDVSTGVVRDIGILTQRFEDQGRFIAGAADTLQETHRRIDTTLSDRRDAIERFTSLLGNRASDMEERLIRFNRLLQDSLGAAEERAHEIAKLVADSTAQSTNAISQQYDVLRSHSEEERERTQESLKQSYDRTMDEVRAIFSDANQRFAQAAGELREVAVEVQNALETTRQELKRGVLELPHETQESTNAMRRVVADQIKALSELNEIVSRHARGIDVVEPRQIAAQVAYRNEPAAAIAGPRIVARTEPVAEYAPPRQPMPRATQMRAVEQEPVEMLPPAPMQQAPAEPQQPSAPPAPRRGGGQRQSGAWLNDLLSRAPAKEAKEEEADEPDTVGSIDSLSTDIARMIDHDSAVEFWSRYKRGERNVVTRRLYTAQGQKTFEEIRKRYRKSAAFRETVDRYIDEFERLLEQVGRDDRGQTLTKTYLTSDTGKVYTLLSHAAGRLG